MAIQLFRVSRRNRRGPQGVYQEDAYDPAYAASHNHDGVTYVPGENGFFDFPSDVEDELLQRVISAPNNRYRLRWLTEGEVDEKSLLDLVTFGEKLHSEPPKAEPKSEPKESAAERKAREKAEKESEDKATTAAEAWKATGLDETEWLRDGDGNLLPPPGA